MKLFTLFYLLAILLFLSCNRKQPDDPPFIKVNKNELNEPATAGRDSVLISANTDWILSTLPSWLHASISKGSTGDTKMVFDFPENTGTAPRNADILIQLESATSLTPILLKFSQSGQAAFINADRTSVEENPAGQVDSILITANTSWTVSIPSSISWLNIDKTSGAAGQTRIHLTTEPNNTTEPRTAELTLQSLNGSTQPLKFTLTQNSNYQITGFLPVSGLPGTLLTLTGIFGANPVVQVNGIAATVTGSSATQIECVVPQNASTGKVSVHCDNNISLVSATDFIVTGTGWVKVAATCTASHSNGISFIYNNKLYVGLGNDLNGILDTTFNIFDPVTGSCTSGTPLPSVIHGRSLASCMVVNNKVFFGFGAGMPSFSTAYKDWWVYDPAVSGNAAWVQMHDLTAAGFGGVAVVVNNKGYVGVPYQNHTLFRLDAVTPAWIADGPTNFPAVQYSSAFTIGSMAYIAGGELNGSASVYTYRFDPFTNNIIRVADIPETIKNASAFTLNGKGYVLSNGANANTYMYDPSTDKWTILNIRPSNDANMSGEFKTGVINGVVYAWDVVNGIVYKFVP